MKYLKKNKWLDNATNQPIKFKTRICVEVNGDARILKSNSRRKCLSQAYVVSLF